MTTQFLILRIQSILEGKINPEPSQLRAIASEYKRVSEDTERRLVHCASLIRAGRDHIALQVAETEPQLLESINELVFPELEEWRLYCNNNSLPLPPVFNASQMALVKSLYTREISQNHPLYRDYRRAMRMHDYDEALSIIRTISKVNVTNAAAKQECERLQKRLIVDKFYKAKDAWLENRENDALQIAREIKDDADLIIHDVVWRTMSQRLEKFEAHEAQKRLGEITDELRGLAMSDDYQKILALGAEYDILSEKFAITQSDANIIFVKEQTKRAGAIQDKQIEAEKKTAAVRAINADLSSNIRRDPRPRLKELESLKTAAGEMLDNETAAKLSSVMGGLKFRIMLMRVRNAAAGAVVVCAVGYASWYGYSEYKEYKRLNDAKALFASMRNSPTLKDAQKRYGVFIQSYADLAETPFFKNDIENFSLTISDQEQNAAAIAEALEALAAADYKSDDPQKWNEAFAIVDQMRADAEKFFPREREQYLERIGRDAEKVILERDKKRAQIAASLDKALSDARQGVDSVDFFSPSLARSLKKTSDAIDFARGIIENPNSLFAPSDMDVEKLETLDALNKSNIRDSESIVGLIEELANPESVELYFDSLSDLASIKRISADKQKLMNAVLNKKDLVIFHVYGGIIAPELAAQTPESFTAYGIDFTGQEMAGRTYRHKNGDKDVFTDGKLEVNTQTWKGGSETVQEANEIAANGNVTTVIYRINRTDGLRARGSVLTEGTLTPESVLARQASNISMDMSPLKALELVANADCNPVFKVWLEKKLVDAMRVDTVKSGLIFSPSLQARVKRIDELSKDLYPHSWMFATPSRTKLIKTELYEKRAPDYLKEATELAQKVRNAYDNPLKLSGYVPLEGLFQTKSVVPPIYGLDTAGEFRVIKDGEGAKFSPLFRDPD